MSIVRKSLVSIVSLTALLFLDISGMVQSLLPESTQEKDLEVSLRFTGEAQAMVLSGVEEALEKLLPGAQDIKEELRLLTEEQKKEIKEKSGSEFDSLLDGEFHFFIGSTDGRIAGYALRSSVKGKWGPIHYMLSLDPQGRVMDVMVLEHSEKRASQIAKKKFLKQFAGKTIKDKIELRKDIHAITGATISSRAITTGIKAAIYVFNELYVNG